MVGFEFRTLNGNHVNFDSVSTPASCFRALDDVHVFAHAKPLYINSIIIAVIVAESNGGGIREEGRVSHFCRVEGVSFRTKRSPCSRYCLHSERDNYVSILWHLFYANKYRLIIERDIADNSGSCSRVACCHKRQETGEH